MARKKIPYPCKPCIHAVWDRTDKCYVCDRNGVKCTETATYTPCVDNVNHILGE